MSDRPVRAMVMAAGAGTRLRPLTHDIPKPMVPILNKPVLEYTVENLRRHGITEMVFNLHSHPDMIRRHFGDGRAWGVKIHYSYEPHLMGTAGGVKKAERFLKGGTFLVLSGDGLTDINLEALIEFHRKRRATATLALKKVDMRFDYGVALTRGDGRIRRFVEKPSWSDVFANTVNTGIYVFEPEIFKKIPKSRSYDFGYQFWPKLLKERRRVFGQVSNSYWCDVGNLGEYRRAQHDALDGKVQLAMSGRQIRPGIWVERGARIEAGVRLEAPCLIGAETLVRRGATVGAYTVIGRRSQIGARSSLHNCILWDKVLVGNGVKLANCILGHGAKAVESVSVYEGAVIQLSTAAASGINRK